MAKFDFLEEKYDLKRQESKFPVAYTGKIKNYYTVVEIDERGGSSQTYTIRIGASTSMLRDQTIFEEEIMSAYKVLSVEFSPYMIVITGNNRFRAGKMQEVIEGIFETTTNQLQALNIPSGDFKNGQDDYSVSLYRVENTYQFLSTQSMKEMEVEFEGTMTELDQSEESIQAGLGGAMLGALIGAVVWGILFYFGYYAWFAAILGIHLGFKFYREKGGVLSIAGMLAVTGLVVLTLFLANYLVYTLALSQGLTEFGFTFSIVFLNLFVLLTELQMMAPFLLDLILGLGIAILIGAIYSYRLYNTSKNEKTIRKV